nr:TATA-box-binding protein-like [Procambarus clarkii]
MVAAHQCLTLELFAGTLMFLVTVAFLGALCAHGAAAEEEETQQEQQEQLKQEQQKQEQQKQEQQKQEQQKQGQQEQEQQQEQQERHKLPSAKEVARLIFTSTEQFISLSDSSSLAMTLLLLLLLGAATGLAISGALGHNSVLLNRVLAPL